LFRAPAAGKLADPVAQASREAADLALAALSADGASRD